MFVNIEPSTYAKAQMPAIAAPSSLQWQPGKILCPFVVYKDTKGGTIQRRELHNLPQANVHTIQKKEWFNKEVVLEWVDNILAPYGAMAPIGIIPILFLDVLKVHLLGSMADAIYKLGVEIEFIPPGWTGLFLPINVGANYMELYTNFLMDQAANNPLPGAKREDVSWWILEAVGEISKETVKNARQKKGYSYYEE